MARVKGPPACRVCGRPEGWGNLLATVQGELEEAEEALGEMIGTEHEEYSQGRLDGMRTLAKILGLTMEGRQE